MQKIGVIGAGAWGTALSTVARRAGRDVVLWAREEGLAATINQTAENPTYLAGVSLDPAIRATSSIKDCVDADAVLAVCPAQVLRQTIELSNEYWKPKTPVVICCKGIEQETQAMMNEVVRDVLPDVPVAVLSGPTFAKEVASNLPTAVTLASKDLNLAKQLAEALATPGFRIYTTDDVAGAEIGGAVKNVLAIACGIVEGKGLGDNARAALITRGLAEIARLGAVKGARTETLMGLSGIGDVTLTCNAMQSRNFSLGYELGKGTSLNDILSKRNTVAEGVATAASVTKLAASLSVEMPIAEAVNAILHQGVAIETAIARLLSRPTALEAI